MLSLFVAHAWLWGCSPLRRAFRKGRAVSTARKGLLYQCPDPSPGRLSLGSEASPKATPLLRKSVEKGVFLDQNLADKRQHQLPGCPRSSFCPPFQGGHTDWPGRTKVLKDSSTTVPPGGLKVGHLSPLSCPFQSTDPCSHPALSKPHLKSPTFPGSFLSHAYPPISS